MAIRKTSSLVIATMACIGAGCGGANTTTDDAAGVDPAQPDMAMAPLPPDLLPPPPDLAQRPYPQPPYGTKIGDVISDFNSKGYFLTPEQTDYTQLTYGVVHLSDLTRKYNCKCIILTMAAEWCGPCNMEQPGLIDAVAKDASLCVFEVLLDGYTMGTPAARTDLEDWVGHYNHDFPVVVPSIQTAGRIPKTPGIPTNVVIDPNTMKILDIISGYDPNGVDTAKMTCQAAQ